MKRSQAADLIDAVRRLAAADAGGMFDLGKDLRSLLAQYDLPPLVVCSGEAHSNPHIRWCMQCAPRWGYVGAKEPVR